MQRGRVSLWFRQKKIENFSTWKKKAQNPYVNQRIK